MKKIICRYKLGFIPLITLFCSVNAQSTKFNTELNTYTKEIAVNNKTNKPSSAYEISNPGVSSKALKNFNKSFKDAINTTWFEIKEGYMAKFTRDDIETKVFYDRRGGWIGSVRNYQEDKLPKHVRHQVKSNYYDYNIFLVQEVTVGNTTAYLVKVEDKNSIKIIRVIDGEMDEYQAFQKSK